MRGLIITILICTVFAGVALAKDFEVTGIIQEKEAAAIINGKIVSVGDQIDGAKVTKIEGKRVFLNYKGKIIEKNVTGRLVGLLEESLNSNKINKKKTNRIYINILVFIIIFTIAGGLFISKRLNNKQNNNVDNNLN